MAAHEALCDLGVQVESYGTGTAVRLPGPTADKPNVYDFGTPYASMYEELLRKDERLYTANGLLEMLDRNRRIKIAPMRWQDNTREKTFDVVYTCEERVFDSVCKDLMRREPGAVPVHVINVEIKDNHEEASVGARIITQLTKCLETSDDLDANIEQILFDFTKKFPSNKILHSVCFI